MKFCNKCGMALNDGGTCPNCSPNAFCVKCGKEVAGAYCTHCGTERHGASKRSAPPQKKMRSSTVAVIAVAALLISAGVIYYFVDNAHRAYVAVYVHSIHITESVDIVAYVDGDQMLTSHDLKPGYYAYNTRYYVYTFSLLDSSKVITVSAMSLGGGLGPVYDEKKILVENGGKYSVDLYV